MNDMQKMIEIEDLKFLVEQLGFSIAVCANNIELVVNKFDSKNNQKFYTISDLKMFLRGVNFSILNPEVFK